MVSRTFFQILGDWNSFNSSQCLRRASPSHVSIRIFWPKTIRYNNWPNDWPTNVWMIAILNNLFWHVFRFLPVGMDFFRDIFGLPDHLPSGRCLKLPDQRLFFAAKSIGSYEASSPTGKKHQELGEDEQVVWIYFFVYNSYSWCNATWRERNSRVFPPILHPYLWWRWPRFLCARRRLFPLENHFWESIPATSPQLRISFQTKKVP